MAEMYVLKALFDALENPKHTHSHWVRRPWWKWTVHYNHEWNRWDSGDLKNVGSLTPPFYIRKGDAVEVPCHGTITPRSGPKVEKDRGPFYTKVVASRQFECDAPVVGTRMDVLLYAAARLEDG